MQRPLITILTPVLNEEQILPLYEERIRKELFSSREVRFEVILIDDGSTDSSWSLIQAMCARDNRFRALSLSRNFGSHLALAAGFDACQGDAVVPLACDLQDPPSVIYEFIQKWKKGSEIVWGHRLKRRDRAWRVFVSQVFTALIRRFAMPKGSKFATGSFFLADRKVIDASLQFRERNRVTFALIAAMGFKQDVVQYSREKRMAGSSRWSFAQMLKTMYDTLIGFSYLPIRFITVVGVLTSLFAVGFSIYLLSLWIFKRPIMGWTSQLLVMNFFFGIQFFLMGIMGEYLYRIYAEILRRPLYLIREKSCNWALDSETSFIKSDDKSRAPRASYSA